MNRRRAMLLTAVIAGLVAVGYGSWRFRAALFGSSADRDRVTVSGNIEAHESVLGFTQVQTPIVELPFDGGANVARSSRSTISTMSGNAERVALVYRIRIDIANPTHELLPGMPADAVLARLPAGVAAELAPLLYAAVIHVATCVLDLDQSQASRGLISHFVATGRFDVVDVAATQRQVAKDLDSGLATGRS